MPNQAQLQSALVYHHLGLGDHIDCNGIVRLIAKSHAFVYLFVKKRNIANIRKMYRDDPCIKFIEFDEETAGRERDFVKQTRKRMSLGPQHVLNYFEIGHSFYKDAGDSKNCREIFYEQFGLNFWDIRDLFYYERDIENEERVLKKLNPFGEDYIFVHDDPSRGFVVNKEHVRSDLKIIHNDISESVFDLIGVIQNATEVHCMESSLKSIVDMIPQKNKLFFHDFRGHPLGRTFNEWTTISYV